MRKQLLKYFVGFGIMAFSAVPMSAGVVGGPASVVMAAEDEPKGSQGNPYTVAELLPLDGKTDKIPEKWFEGYIVGYVAGNVYSQGAAIGLPDDPDCITNVIIAGSKDEADVNQCIPVQLPYGAVRDALNIYVNKENLGKRVNINGDFDLYFSRGGIKKVKEFEWLADELKAPDYTMYVIGSNVNGSEWTEGDEAAKMTYTAEGIWEWDGELLGAEFKFNDGTWSGSYNIGSDQESNPELVLGIPFTVVNSGDSRNITLNSKISEVVNPHVVLDMNAMTVTVTGGANRVKPVLLTVRIEDYSTFSYEVAKNEETTLTLGFEDADWAIGEATLNGAPLENVTGNKSDISFMVEDASELVLKAVYTGEIKFEIDNGGGNDNSVRSLYDNVMLGVIDGKVVVTGIGDGHQVEVFNMGGRKEASVTSADGNVEISLAKGQAYIVRVGAYAAKVVL